jgi:uncharacterized protein YndB with AHSA1/START domain
LPLADGPAERGDDGSECNWGRVLAWDPPHRLLVTWQINGQWQYDLDRLADGQAIHDTIVFGGGGWTAILERFAAAATT